MSEPHHITHTARLLGMSGSEREAADRRAMAEREERDLAELRAKVMLMREITYLVEHGLGQRSPDTRSAGERVNAAMATKHGPPSAAAVRAPALPSVAGPSTPPSRDHRAHLYSDSLKDSDRLRRAGTESKLGGRHKDTAYRAKRLAALRDPFESSKTLSANMLRASNAAEKFIRDFMRDIK